ncbi:hypothetical protein D3C73_1075940 [compost metagenome]
MSAWVKKLFALPMMVPRLFTSGPEATTWFTLASTPIALAKRTVSRTVCSLSLSITAMKSGRYPMRSRKRLETFQKSSSVKTLPSPFKRLSPYWKLVVTPMRGCLKSSSHRCGFL